jgi:hypothetical protein
MNWLRSTLLILLFLAAPAAYAGELSLKFDYDVTVSIPSQDGISSPHKYAAGEQVTLKSDQVYWIESKGKVPALVVPNSYSKKEPMKVSLAEVTDWPSTTTERIVDNKMSVMMDLMTQFQAQLTKKNVNAAEETLNRMAAVEDLSSLDIFRAYLAYMKGDIEKAKLTVRRALALHPENAQGQELLKTLEGKKP